MKKKLLNALTCTLVTFLFSAVVAAAGSFGIKLKDGSTIAIATLYECQPERLKGGGVQCTDTANFPDSAKGQRSTTLQSTQLPLKQFLRPRSLSEQQFKADMKTWMGIFAEYQAKLANEYAARPSPNTVVHRATTDKLPSAKIPNGLDACAQFEIDLSLKNTSAGTIRADRSGAFCLKYIETRKEIIQIQFTQNTIRSSKKAGQVFPNRAPAHARETQRTFKSLRNY